MSRIAIGWREWVALPGLRIPAIKAKIDTGARTSCLHALKIQTFRRGGELWVRFSVPPVQGKKKLLVNCEAKVIARRRITDSGGHRELRYVIAAMLAMGEAAWPIEMTLTNRDAMRFRMLLGRKALEGRVEIDPGRSFLLGRIGPASARQLYASPPR